MNPEKPISKNRFCGAFHILKFREYDYDHAKTKMAVNPWYWRHKSETYVNVKWQYCAIVKRSKHAWPQAAFISPILPNTIKSRNEKAMNCYINIIKRHANIISVWENNP